MVARIKFVGAKTWTLRRLPPDVAAQFSKCSHGKALGGTEGAPDCVSCHKSPIAGTADKLARKQTQEEICPPATATIRTSRTG